MNKLKLLTISLIIIMAAIFALAWVMPAQAAPPNNDDFYFATQITGLPFSETIVTSEATAGPNDPYPCGYYPENSVWYSYTPSTSGLVQISTLNSDYELAVGIYTGNYGSLGEISCGVGPGRLITYLDAGASYSIVVVGTGSFPFPPGGTLRFRLDPISTPVNDDFDNAKLVPALPYTDSMNSSYATWESDDPTGCWHNSGSVWYAYTPQEDVYLEANTYGSYYDTTLAVYTGTRGSLDLVPGCCNDDHYGPQSYVYFPAAANTTYYFLVGRCCGQGGDGGGYLVFNVLEQFPPENDDFANATQVDQLPYYQEGNNQFATIEPQEPPSNCAWWGINRTVWFRYTPSQSGSLFARADGFYFQVRAVYEGTSLGQLIELGCLNGYDPLVVQAEAGKTYYFQFGSIYDWDYGYYGFHLDWAPPPQADFWWNPGNPNRYQAIEFCDNSSDPAGIGIPDGGMTWDFEDGSTGTGFCVYHTFANDGDYPVLHEVTTYDGRTAAVTRTISIRTHDVAITKFLTPAAASPGQTRQITVGIRNYNYPETVEVRLYKSTPYGSQVVQTKSQSIPVYPGNRTTDVKFDYTFTDQDAIPGRVSLWASVFIYDYPDAIARDNEAIGKPTKINPSNNKPAPYYAAVAAPPGAAPAAATFGLLSMGLAFGFFLVMGNPRRRGGRAHNKND